MISHLSRRQLLNLAVLVGTTIWSALFILPYVAGRGGLMDSFEFRLVDLRHTLTGTRPAAEDVVVVAIDDDTLAADTAGGRQRLAALISGIAESGAHALALDIVLADPGDPAKNAKLAEALASLPTGIAAAASYDAEQSIPTTVIWPQPVFREAAQAGLVNLSTDKRGIPRYAPLLFEVDSGFVPSLALVAALAFTKENPSFGEGRLTLGDRHIPLDFGFNMPLRIVGPARSVPTYSASALLGGQMQEALSGKLVVLGFTASAMGDRFATPFDDSTPGVEIIATAISQLIGGTTLRRDTQTRWWDALHAEVLALVAVFAILVLPLSRGLPAALVLLAVSMLVVTLCFASGLWLSAALPLVVTVPPLLIAGTFRYRQEQSDASRSERTVASLRRFQSPALAKKIENDPEYLATPVEQHLVICFFDLSGFTGLSQRLGPANTRELLRVFHRLTANAVEENDGSVFNYMGDGALAVFGLDTDTTVTSANNALGAAFNLVSTLSQQRLESLPDEMLMCRIGLHVGPVTLSRLGADNYQQLTVTGDSVNLASRLLEVAKTENAAVAASDAFAAALRRHALVDRAQNTEVPIRGRAGLVRVLLWTQEDIVARDLG